MIASQVCLLSPGSTAISEAWFARRDQVVTRLSELLKAEDTHDHVALADALLKLSPANENAINTLIAALDSDEQTKNARAAAALAMADTNSENFRRAVVARVEDGRIGDAITPMFSLLGPQALPIIEPLLFEQTDLGSHVRANLVVAMKPAGVAALDLLERAVVDADPLVRITAGNLLRDLGPEALPAIPAMTRSIGMDDRDARIAVSRSLGELGPIAIPALIRAVRESPEHFTRLNSIVLLGQLNRDAKDAIPLLVEVAVKEEDLRSRAVDAIAAIDSAEGSGHLFGGGDTYTGTDSLPILRDYLESMEIDTRLKTVEVLTLLSEHEGLGENPVVELVDLALADVDERVRDKAALAAVIAFEDAKPNPLALASFVKLLRHSDQEVRERASMSIWKIGPPLAPWTRDLLEAESAPANETSGTYAGHALREIGMAALPYLRKCLADESPKIRAGAASIIGSLGKDAVEAVPDLIIQLDDANEQVRFAAADTLVGIGTTSTKVLDVIEEIVKNSSEDWHRQWGVRLLRDLGPIDPERVSTVLNRALNHADPETRLNAAESLLAIDNSKEPAIQTLMDLLPLGINVSTSAAMRLAQLDGEKERVAPAIRRALGDLPEDADGNLTMYFVRALIECNVIDELIDGLNQDQLGTFTTGEGMEAIVKLLPTHLDRIPKVASLLSNKAEDVREQAAKILGSVGPAAMGALPALQLASSDSSDSVRSAALSAINQLRAQELLDADDEVTRLEAAENLLQRDLHSDRIVSVLSAIVSNSSDPNLRIRGVEGLGKVGDAQRAKAAQVMNECLKDEIAIVRFNAAKGLLKLNAHVNDAVAELNAVVLAGLEDDEYSYCSSAAELLADLGSPIPETVSSLQTAARKFPDYRSAFLEALGKLHAIEALVQLLDESENEDDVDEILNEIESALEEDSQAIEKLAPMLKHVNVTRRIQGIKTLGNLSADEEERRKALQHLLNDDEQEVRVAAAETLKRIDLENKSP